ncbi:MAG TPA: RES family NAD+ phosphorylase [Candidatus Baltobacteraceae bacterium]
MTRLAWQTSYRIIPSRYPATGLFDEVADPADLAVVLELEAGTNPRVLDEAGELSMVRPEDRISGPHTAAIMAAFAHTQPSRFSDGSFGVYYAASDEATAIAETAYHRARFLQNAGFANERLDMRVYTAAIHGDFDDVRAKTARSKLYDPDSYAYSSAYAAKLYRRNVVDGIAYRCVRRHAGECVGVFRPAAVTHCQVLHHLQYRFEDFRLNAVYEISMRA